MSETPEANTPASQENDILQRLRADPKDHKALYEANALYWRFVSEFVRNQAGGPQKEEIDLSGPRQIIDFGVFDLAILEKESPARGKVEALLKKKDEDSSGLHFLSSWIQRQYKILLNFNKRNAIKAAIAAGERELAKLAEEVENLQRARADLYTKTIRDVLSRRGNFSNALFEQYKGKAEQFCVRESMLLESLLRKRSIARGVFMNLDEKRTHIQKEKELESLGERCNSYIGEMGQNVTEGNVRLIGSKVDEKIRKTVDSRERVRKLREDLEKVTEESSLLTPAEVSLRLGEEIDYIRDLTKLSSNRCRCEPISVLHGMQDMITPEAVAEVLDRVDEFDPYLYRNDRVANIGRPAVLLVPGKGNGLYDWKNNALVIPLMPVMGADVSVISAVVEFRIDIDEEKKVMYSYNQIKEYAGIKSGWALRQRFVKDYTIWMLSESKGYRLLSRDVRTWFEHEIGPGKNEVIVPLKYAMFQFNQKQFDEVFSSLQLKTSTEGSNDPEAWFGLGIIHAQREKWDKAEEAFSRSVSLAPAEPRPMYNLALSCWKNGKKQDAIKHFTNYIKLNPASWWSAVAREHIMKLK